MGSAVRVKGMSGIACYVLGPTKEWDEDFEEWVDGDGSRLRVVMVGDDHVYKVDADDCTPIAPEDFCDGCGQIGCGHGSVRED